MATTVPRPIDCPRSTTKGEGSDGLSRWVAERTEATTTRSGPGSEKVWSARQRRDMVDRLGDRRSKGRVSQAGTETTSEQKREMSSASSSASRSSGTTTSSGPFRLWRKADNAMARPSGATAHRPGGAGKRAGGHRSTRVESGGEAKPQVC